MSMENDNDNNFSFDTLAFWIGYLFLMILCSLSKLAAIIFCSACGVAVLIYVAFWILPYRIGPLERSICKRLGKEGYHYEKNEGTLYVTKNDSRNHAYRAIGEAIEDYGKLIPYLERDYPNTAENQSSIGFRQNEQ